MSSETTKLKKRSGGASTGEPKLSVAIEYVGIIAIVCLFTGVIVGGSIGHKQGAKSAGPPGDVSHSAAAPGGAASIEAALAQIKQETNRDKLIDMGNHAYDNGRPDIAIPAYEKALTYHPDDPNVLTDLAAMYLMAEQPNRTVELAKRAAELDGKHAQSRYWMGRGLVALGDKEGARKAFLEVKKAAPGGDLAREVDKEMDKLGG